MLVSKKQSIEDIVVETLAKHPYQEGPALVLLVQKFRKNTTKQAVYSALKSLLESETVAKVGGKYFLSRVWLHKINKLFQDQKEKELLSDTIFDLQDKESISYHFPSLLTCDTYWAHVFSILIEWIPADRPIFVWNPHEWFVIGRKAVETDIFKEFSAKNKYAFYTIGSKTPLDTEFKKTWANTHVSINTDDSISFPNNYYLNIFDDFIVEVFIDEKLANEIENFYKNNQKLTPDNIALFEKLISHKYAVRMKITRKSKKAQLLRKKLAKDFYIQKELKID